MKAIQYTLRVNSIMMRLTVLLFSILSVSTIFFSCQDFVDLGPPSTQTTTSNVYNNDATATAALFSIYSRMFSETNFSSLISISNGLLSDELIPFNEGAMEFFNNGISPSNGDILSHWSTIYQYIYSANGVLEGLSTSEGVSDKVAKQLEGEAKLIRSFCNFYLVTLWGDIPLITTTDYRINLGASRSPKAAVYQQTIKDLQEAEILLSNDYAFSNGDRSRPNKWAATALLARVYLHMEDWTNAEAKATEVINNNNYSLVADLNSVFLANSSEAIWQLSSVFPSGTNTYDGNAFILNSAPTYVALSEQLVNSFETDDNRRRDWINAFTDGGQTWYYPFKYKISGNIDPSAPISEYLMILRLAEQYLIRAEARLQLHNVLGGQADLNTIRNRAGLTNTTFLDESSLLVAVEKERQVEFFTEWSHRWLDLKRKGRATTILMPIKGSNWQESDILYPIPQTELERNPNLVQNPGYN